MAGSAVIGHCQGGGSKILLLCLSGDRSAIGTLAGKFKIRSLLRPFAAAVMSEITTEIGDANEENNGKC